MSLIHQKNLIKKTPMMELMDEMQKSPLMFASALELIEQMRMLDKERRAIVSAFAWGNITKVQYKGQHIAGEDYYNDRYNETKEK